MLSSYKFFAIYQSVQLHFTSSYDLFKYAGKSKSINKTTFDNRKDRQRFIFWAEKLDNSDDAFKFCVFNFLKNSKWFYASFEDAKSQYINGKKFYSTFTKNITKDHSILKTIKEDQGLSFEDLLKETKKGNKPPLLQIYLNGLISIEFMCLLDRSYNFITDWQNKYTNDPLISDELFKVEKYKQFVIIFSKQRN